MSDPGSTWCPLCETWLHKPLWPEDYPPQGTDGVYYDLTAITQLLEAQYQVLLAEHLVEHTTEKRDT